MLRITLVLDFSGADGSPLPSRSTPQKALLVTSSPHTTPQNSQSDCFALHDSSNRFKGMSSLTIGAGTPLHIGVDRPRTEFETTSMERGLRHGWCAWTWFLDVWHDEGLMVELVCRDREHARLVACYLAPPSSLPRFSRTRSRSAKSVSIS